MNRAHEESAPTYEEEYKEPQSPTENTFSGQEPQETFLSPGAYLESHEYAPISPTPSFFPERGFRSPVEFSPLPFSPGAIIHPDREVHPAWPIFE